MSKRAISAAAPELPLLERRWTPARIGLGASARELGFLVLIGLSIMWSWQPLTTVIVRSLNSEGYKHYSHIILLPRARICSIPSATILQNAKPRLRLNSSARR